MKTALGAVLIIAAALYLPKCQAESGLWGSIGFTKHADPSSGCSVNPGVFKMWRGESWRWYLGGHQKSDCDIGLVGGVAWLPWKYGRYSAGGTAMLLTDYGPPVFPAAAPAVSYDEKRQGADFVWIPGVIAHLRFRWSFD